MYGGPRQETESQEPAPSPSRPTLRGAARILAPTPWTAARPGPHPPDTKGARHCVLGVWLPGPDVASVVLAHVVGYDDCRLSVLKAVPQGLAGMPNPAFHHILAFFFLTTAKETVCSGPLQNTFDDPCCVVAHRVKVPQSVPSAAREQAPSFQGRALLSGLSSSARLLVEQAC